MTFIWRYDFPLGSIPPAAIEEPRGPGRQERPAAAAD